MSLLQELVNPNTVNLTNTQQGCLIIIKISATPEVAYESTNGKEQTVYARNTLRLLGLIKVGGNKTALTQTGEQVLINYNLTDETGQPTERGLQILDSYNKQFGDGAEGVTQDDSQEQPPTDNF